MPNVRSAREDIYHFMCVCFFLTFVIHSQILMPAGGGDYQVFQAPPSSCGRYPRLCKSPNDTANNCSAFCCVNTSYIVTDLCASISPTGLRLVRVDYCDYKILYLYISRAPAFDFAFATLQQKKKKVKSRYALPRSMSRGIIDLSLIEFR
jgi:hypothetical protein